MLAFWLDAHAPRWRSVVPLAPLRSAFGATAVDSRANYYQDKPIRLPAPNGATSVNAQYATCAWLLSPLALTVLPLCVFVVLGGLAATQVLLVLAYKIVLALLMLLPDITVSTTADADPAPQTPDDTAAAADATGESEEKSK